MANKKSNRTEKNNTRVNGVVDMDGGFWKLLGVPMIVIVIGVIPIAVGFVNDWGDIGISIDPYGRGVLIFIGLCLIAIGSWLLSEIQLKSHYFTNKKYKIFRWVFITILAGILIAGILAITRDNTKNKCPVVLTESPEETITLTHTLTLTPTYTITPTLIPTQTSMPTTDAISATECELRENPLKPCNWIVTSGDSHISIAKDTYGDPSYALIVLNFNRDDDGYRSSTKGILYLPVWEDIPNPLEPVFPTDNSYPRYYAECQKNGNKPCYYIAKDGDTYPWIAELYYGTEQASKCIEEANLWLNLDIEEFKQIDEIDIAGKMLILPKRDLARCPGE